MTQQNTFLIFKTIILLHFLESLEHLDTTPSQPLLLGYTSKLSSHIIIIYHHRVIVLAYLAPY